MFTRSSAGRRVSVTDRPATFSSLHTRNFRIFLTGQLISNIGGWAQRIAQDWLVLTLTGSATAVGIVVALQLMPSIVLGPLGGVVADRMSKKTVLLVTQSVMLSCSVLLAVLSLSGAVLPWHIYLIAVIAGVVTAIDNPTRQAFVNEMVGPSLLRNAISLNSAAFQVGALVGPAIAGTLIAMVGIGASFVLNAITFVVVIGALTRVRTSDLHRRPVPAPNEERSEGALRELLGRPEMRWPAVLVGVFTVFTASFPVTMAAFANREFHTTAAGFAMLTCALAVGSLLGSLAAARRAELRLRGLVGLSLWLCAAQLIAAAAPSPITLAICLVAVGFCWVMLGVSGNAGVQLAAGDHNRGRIMGLYLLVVTGAGCLGGPVVGAINEHAGPRAALVLGSLVPALVTLFVGLRLARGAGIEVVPSVRRRLVVSTQQVKARALHPLGH